jgi:hypothetical protein
MIALVLRDEILAAQPVPKIGFCPLLKEIVRVNNTRNSPVMELLGRKREFMAAGFAEVSAKKRAHPSPAAFWNRDYECITA